MTHVVALYESCSVIHERHFIRLASMHEYRDDQVRRPTMTNSYRYEFTLELPSNATAISYPYNTVTEGYKNLKIYVIPEDARCDYYIEGDRLMIQFPQQLTHCGKLTIVFEYEVTFRPRYVQPEQIVIPPFTFESYPMVWRFKNCPDKTELYFSRPPAIETTEPNWYSTPNNLKDTVDTSYVPYSDGKEFTRFYKLPRIASNQTLFVEFFARATQSVRYWLAMGGYFAMAAVTSMIIMFFLKDIHLFDRIFDIGTIMGGTFAALFAVYSWIYEDEIRISGSYTMRRAYIALAIITLAVGSVLIAILTFVMGSQYNGIL